MKVGVVVVTFNRCGLLKGCIEALRNQDRAPDRIYVVNNGSTDDTAAWLDAQQGLAVFHQGNLGGAGGFSRGVKEAYADGCDWIWIMDDDCYAQPNCISEMLEALATKPAIKAAAPLVLDRDGVIDTRHRGYINLEQYAKITRPIAADISTNTEVDFASFVGLMIHREVVEAVGYPSQEFFISCDDLEYCIRINRFTKVLLCAQAAVLHLENASKEQAGAKANRIPLDKLWIRYYGERNVVYLRKKWLANGSLSGNMRVMKLLLQSMLRQTKDVLLHDDHKVKRLRFYYNAYIDGWRGYFDNSKPRRILYGATSVGSPAKAGVKLGAASQKVA